MNIVCVIPARGGSKGIIDKNIRHVGGIPLVARSVLASTSSKIITQTYVSSDSIKILDIGERYGALAVKRSKDVSSDTSSTEDALFHFLEWLCAKNISIDILVYLQCTSPFTTSEDIDKVVTALIDNNNIDCAFSAIEDHSFLWSINKNGYATGVNHFGYKQRQRRQDLFDITYKENGSIYAIRPKALLASGNRFGSKALPVLAGGVLPFEIDNLHELYMAQLVSRLFPDPVRKLKYSNIKVVVMDFDGVHTNDTLILDQNGVESVQVSRADGLGCGLLKSSGYKLLILTREENPVVLMRAKKLKIDIINGVKDKILVLKEWCKKNNLKKDQVAYIGNDMNDLECLKWAGLAMIPAGAKSPGTKWYS